MKKQSVYIIILFLLMSIATGNDRKAEPFSTIQWAAGPLMNVGHSDINRYWRYSGGFTMNARTPFYFGFTEVGVALHFYDEYKALEFTQIHCYLSFLKEFSILKKIPTYLGVTVGNSLFCFDAEENQRLQNESELTLGIIGCIEIPVTRKLSAAINSQYSNVFTYHIIETTNLGLLVMYKITTPCWISELLK
ncbi:MAG: hypothetical protein DRP96_00570 [Candidatus Neomarinimicrobiota bacterium]|nr:MAG: hypothetical protein DRP96_00570 [Candidatus Neomarinimicrobiota bacterium]